MENQERHYNITKLNRLFAIAAVALLVSLVFMFVDDYSREWKEYQRQFRALDVAKTRANYDAEITKLKDKDDYAAVLAKLDAAQADVKGKSAQLKPLQKELTKLTAKSEIFQQKYQFAKAQLDAAKFEYEAAMAHHPKDAKSKEAKYERVLKEFEKLRVALEGAQDAVSKQTAKIQELSASVRQLEKEKGALSKQADIFERKLKSIDPKKMSFANRLAESLRNLPVMDLANPSYKVEQIVVKDITDNVNFMRVPKVDRCVTCHQGIMKPGFEDAPQPFRTHPNLELFLSSNSPHPFDEYGCTSCHAGRGRGTDFTSAAHRPSTPEQRKEWEKKYNWKLFTYWEAPMYPLKNVQAGCFVCHENQTVIKGAEKLNLGLNLIEKAACFGCHNIDRYKDWPKVGPELTHIGSKMSPDWAYQWIRDPSAIRHNTWMPSFFNQSNTNDEASEKRSEQEIHAMVHYLFSHDKDYELQKVPVTGDAKNGGKLVASLGCFGCHEIQPDKTKTKITTREVLMREHGPNLLGLKTKTTPEWLYNWLKDPKRYHAETRMPSLRLNDQEAADITSYLMEEEFDQKTSAVPPVNEEILNTIVNDFLIKMTTVADAKKQAEAMSRDEKLEFAGRKLIKHYGCFACHIIPGFEKEKPIGTDLTEEGSKSIHNLDFGFVHIEHTPDAWFAQKLKDPRIFDQNRTRIPDEKLKMPNFNFSEEEVDAVVTALMGFVKTRPDVSKLQPKTPRNLAINEGQHLIREFNCNSCHLIEGEGGAINPTVLDWLVKFEGKDASDAKALAASFSPPNLTGEGEKVQSEWLFHFIHNPETIRPWLKVRMPTFGLSDAQTNSFIRYFSYLDNEDFPFIAPTDVKMSAEELTAGETLFSKNYFNCGSCHIVGSQMPSGSQESWAPDFALAKRRLKPDWIIKWLKNPQALLPGTKMPTFFDPSYFDQSGPDDILKGDENEQIRVLRDYLLTLTGHAPSATEPQPAPVPPAQAE